MRPIGNNLVLVPRLTRSRADIVRLMSITLGNIDASNVTTTENGAPFILDFHWLLITNLPALLIAPKVSFSVRDRGPRESIPLTLFGYSSYRFAFLEVDLRRASRWSSLLFLET